MKMPQIRQIPNDARYMYFSAMMMPVGITFETGITAMKNHSKPKPTSRSFFIKTIVRMNSPMTASHAARAFGSASVVVRLIL